jgi:MFS family permease
MRRFRTALTKDFSLLLYIALTTTVCHLLIGGNYGYFIDELYTLACSRHVSLAFVDIPPVAPALLSLSTALFGDSLFAIHILPSIFCGVMVIIVGLMARELGGKRLAMLTAGIAAAFVPVWMALGSLFTYDFLDQLTLVLLFFSLLKLLKTENLKWWLVIGAIAGIGLMVKPSEIFFIASMALGLLLTKHRRMYATKWPWLGALVAFVIILPAIIWQAAHNFPIAEYWLSYSSYRTVRVGILEFILMQVIGVNPFLLPVWAAGLCYFLFHREGKRYRLLGVIYGLLSLILLFTGAKMYMPIPVYAMLLAGGALVIERFACKKGRKVLVAVFLCLIVVTGVIESPNFMPILPVDSLISYYDTVGSLIGAKSIKLDNGGAAVLPQFLYDRFEWDVLVRDMAEVYNSLPEEQRKDTAVVSLYYGAAGAVDQLGGAYGLPKATCGHLNYYFFGLDRVESKTWIVVGGSQYELMQYFSSVKVVKLSHTKYRQPYQTPIFLCTRPKFTPDEAKLALKRFD